MLADEIVRDADEQLVAQALYAVETREAGHWPTVAGILADEVKRLVIERDAVRNRVAGLEAWSNSIALLVPMEKPVSDFQHVYLSTGCLHGNHEYCKSMTGLNGAKRPGECKFCKAKCICACHPKEDQSVPST